jgi:hypothetical protein
MKKQRKLGMTKFTLAWSVLSVVFEHKIILENLLKIKKEFRLYIKKIFNVLFKPDSLKINDENFT